MKAIILALSFLIGTLTYGQGENLKVEKQSSLHSVTLYHANGTIAQQGNVTANNRLHGTWVSYDETGNKKAIGNYANGKKVGTWFFYGKDSKSITQVEFNDKHEISRVHQLIYKNQLAEN